MIQSTFRNAKFISNKFTIVRLIRSKPTKPILRSSPAISKSPSFIAEQFANTFVDDPVDEPKVATMDVGVQVNLNSSAEQQNNQEAVSAKTQWNWVRPSKSAVPDEVRVDDDVIPVLNGFVNLSM